ncbi:MAG: response regulator, partial [Candidatus Angelobacter sp.]
MIELWIASKKDVMTANKGTTKNQIRIVIADDHAVLRESLAALLATDEEFVVAGRAANGQEALAQVQELRPDVLVLDLFMP